MATVTKLPTKQDTAEWTGLFNNELKTQEQSLIFVKRMMALAVSSITYLRGVFPEDAYRSRYLEDLSIKVLRQDSSSVGACKIVRWMMGCFDALEKSYLQIVFIGVCPKTADVNHIIESYQFKFVYTEGGPQMDFIRNENVEMRVTMEDTKKASVLLIRKLFLLMQNLDVLPNDISLTMRLYYYDDVTPSDYEPPGFKEGVSDDLWFEGTAVHFRVGELQTPFHAMKVRVAAEQGRVKKLQEGNHLRENGKAPLTSDQEAAHIGCPADNLPSDEESVEQFKKPKKIPKKIQGNKRTKRTRKEL
ncbi:zebrafish testis-expressed 38 isoform X1 [Alosa sapidissima]|uniref:zebrafish testis-expressed 38 isoform X1 n=1 Tax=Alosa sapidissima TaxID=34773 RepID=UPI001C09DFC3|nr:zebrafish testis-expressed 38 isoform X1 [Alosa sapidissima]